MSAVVSVLDREMYTEAEAARLLGVPPSTLHYWLEGGRQGGKTYRPIIREEPKGIKTVTWAEFVEAGLLREYRRGHGVPMADLRDFVDLLRERFEVPYPLADRRPLTSGKALVFDAQTAAGLGFTHHLVAVAGEQYFLTPPSDSFLRRVDWDGNQAAAWHPDPESPVILSPTVRFGKPSIGGISTAVIWEQDEAGEDVDSIAETFELGVSDVRWALAYENSRRAA